jgi:hypothetical protein
MAEGNMRKRPTMDHKKTKTKQKQKQAKNPQI